MPATQPRSRLGRRVRDRPEVKALVALGLTAAQAWVYLYLFNETLRNGYQLSFREVASAAGISSANGVMGHIRGLVRKGWLDVRAGVGVAQRARACRFKRRPDGGPFLGFAAITGEGGER